MAGGTTVALSVNKADVKAETERDMTGSLKTVWAMQENKAGAATKIQAIARGRSTRNLARVRAVRRSSCTPFPDE